MRPERYKKPDNLPDNCILCGIVGSRAYGIATPESDYDYLGIVVQPLTKFLAIDNGRPQSLSNVGHCAEGDTCYHDVYKFCRLATQGNPTVVELLWTPYDFIVHETDWGIRLRGLRKAFVSQRNIRAYIGYYDQQRRKYTAGKRIHTTTGQWNAEFAAHMLRLMFAARHLLETRNVLVQMEDPTRATVVAARAGEIKPWDVLELCDGARADVEELEKAHPLAQNVNMKIINDLLVRCRLAYKE